jgi:phospholipase/carboxylesterase
MRDVTIAGLTVHLVGGSDREGGGEGPMVVLLHGFGAPGSDLIPLARQLEVPAGLRFAFVEAPHRLRDPEYGFPAEFGEGRAWWMIDLPRWQLALMQGGARELGREVPEGLAAARAALDGVLDELEASYGVQRPVIGGFSQGAMLACDLAFRSRRALAGLVVLSGTLIAEDEWAELMPEREGLPVLQSHGRSDPLLSFDSAVRLREMMSEAGLEVEWVEWAGGHGISDGAVAALGRFLCRVTGATK